MSCLGKRTLGVALAALVVLAIIWAQHGEGPRATATSAPQDRVAAATAPFPPVEGIDVEIRLSPDGPAEAIPASIRFGLARVSAESRARHADWERTGEGIGASQVEDVAVVEQWVSAPTRREEDGTIVAGPFSLPYADRYDLEARSTDRLRVYRASFTATSIPQRVRPQVAAGLRVDVAGLPGNARMQLLRRNESPTADLWQRVLRTETPAVLELFGDAGYPVVSGQTIAPLPPGGFEAVLWVDGVEAGRRLVELPAGRVLPLDVNLTTFRIAEALASRIVVIPMEAGSRQPILGVTALWRGPAGERAITPDALGRLVLAGADLLAHHEIEVRLPVRLDDGGLPRWPSRTTLSLSPDDADLKAVVGTGKDLVRHLEVTPLRWLTLEDARRDSPEPERPYPVFVLQRLQSDDWTDVGSEHFIPQGDDMAVAIDAPGTYRVLRADRPWLIRASTVAVFGSGFANNESVSLSLASARRTALLITRPDGAVLLNHPVVVVGPHRGMPPLAFSTDGHGLLQFEAANVREIFVEPEGMDGTKHQLAR